jgi:hypothetical protein
LKVILDFGGRKDAVCGSLLIGRTGVYQLGALLAMGDNKAESKIRRDVERPIGC